MKNSAISKVKTVIKDLEMLQNGDWNPDHDSCQASIDNLESAAAQLKAPRTCIITGEAMYEGFLLHTDETIKEESSLVAWLKETYKAAYSECSDEFILDDAHEQELYLWTEWYDEYDEAEEKKDSAADQITNFMYFAYNFPTGWIQKAFGEGTSLANHIEAKWQNLNKRNGHGGTANVFNLFMELSDGNRETLCTWVAENYSYKL